MPRILLVEDDPATASAIQSLLGSGGYDILTADNGDAALSLIAREEIDVIIIDIVVRDAPALIMAFHGHVPGVPVVAITSNRHGS